MMIEIQIWKGEKHMFGFSMYVSDKFEVPESFKKAISALYTYHPDFSLLDPDVFIKVVAPSNKKTRPNA